MENSEREDDSEKVPMVFRLNDARPGAWFMRKKDTGKFLGVASRATYPFRMPFSKTN